MTHFASVLHVAYSLIANAISVKVQCEPNLNRKKMLNYQIGDHKKNAVETLHRSTSFFLIFGPHEILLFIRVILHVKSETVLLHNLQSKSMRNGFFFEFLISLLLPQALCFVFPMWNRYIWLLIVDCVIQIVFFCVCKNVQTVSIFAQQIQR